MKSKQNTYLLSAGLLLVWGFIAFKMIFNFGKEEAVISHSFEVKNETKVIKKESFNIKANYKDPFRIGRFQKIKNKKKTVKKITPTKKTQAKKPKTTKKIDISHIKYYGTIKNKSTSKTVGILFINDQEILISNGTEIKNGRVISIQDDKISIIYKEQSFEIKRE